MSTDPQAAPRPLPDRPNLRHLKDQAKDLVKAGTAKSIADAQFKIARLYGFPSWPKLKAHVEAQPKPSPRAGWLWEGRSANMGCRMPDAAGVTTPTRLAMARWMIEN